MSRSILSFQRGREPQAVRVAASQQLELSLSEGAVWRALLPTIALLLLAGLASRLAVVLLPDFPGRDFLGGLFRLDAEANLPSLFSTLLLFGGAAICAVIALTGRQLRDPFTRVWGGLAWLFVYLAVDENAQFHERPAEFIGGLLGTGGFLTYIWVIPYALLCLVLGLSLIRFLLHLPERTRYALLAAGFLYVMGAAGFELIEGQLVWLNALSVNQPPYILLVTVEEGFEMVGMTLLIVTLLGYVRQMLPGLRLTLSLAAPSVTRLEGADRSGRQG